MPKPTFLVLGAPKCGTTSVYYYLKQHPDVYLCRKEVHFFAHGDPLYQDIAVQTWEDYLSLFDEAEDASAIGEVAVRYLYSETAFRNIKKYLPEGKLMVLLRDPVERAFSHFLMRFRTGGMVAKDGTIPSEEKIRKEFDEGKDYVERSLYYKHIKKYYEEFPSRNISVFLLEDIKSEPNETIKNIFKFIGVDEGYSVNTDKRYNVSTVEDYNSLLVTLRRNRFLRYLRSSKIVKRLISGLIPRSLLDRLEWRRAGNSKSIKEVVDLPLDVRRKLVQYYEEDISKLETLIERNLSHWRQVK